MPTPIMQQTYNREYIGLVLQPKKNPSTVAILISPDIGWYQNFNPHFDPFPNTHIIAHFAADTITYEEPTIPPELSTPRKELSTLKILCIHHQNNNIGTYEQLNQLTHIADNLSIQQLYTQIAAHTPRIPMSILTKIGPS